MRAIHSGKGRCTGDDDNDEFSAHFSPAAQHCGGISFCDIAQSAVPFRIGIAALGKNVNAFFRIAARPIQGVSLDTKARDLRGLSLKLNRPNYLP